MNNSKKAVTSIQGAAEYLAVSVETIRSLIDRGELSYTRIGTFIRCRYSDLDDFLKRNTTGNRKLLEKKLFAEICVFIKVWNYVWGSKPVRPTELNNLCKREGLLLDKRGENGERSQVVRLGRMLGSIKEYDFDGLKVKSKNGRKGMLYYLVSSANLASMNKSQSEMIPTDSEQGQFSEVEEMPC